jgi:hypothetical protein
MTDATTQLAPRRIFSLLAAALVCFCQAGCKGKAPSGKPQTLEEGVSQLRAALLNANPDVQSNLYSGVAYSIRYENYLGALVALDRIASDSSLNGQQKKLVNEVAELIKLKIQNQENAPKAAP